MSDRFLLDPSIPVGEATSVLSHSPGALELSSRGMMCRHMHCPTLPNYLSSDRESWFAYIFGPFLPNGRLFHQPSIQIFFLFLILRPNKNNAMVTGYLPVISDVGWFALDLFTSSGKVCTKLPFGLLPRRRLPWVSARSQLLLNEKLEWLQGLSNK